MGNAANITVETRIYKAKGWKEKVNWAFFIN